MSPWKKIFIALFSREQTSCVSKRVEKIDDKHAEIQKDLDDIRFRNDVLHRVIESKTET